MLNLPKPNLLLVGSNMLKPKETPIVGILNFLVNFIWLTIDRYVHGLCTLGLRLQLILQWLTGIAVLICCFLKRKEFSVDVSSKLGSSFSLVPFVIVVVSMLLKFCVYHVFCTAFVHFNTQCSLFCYLFRHSFNFMHIFLSFYRQYARFWLWLLPYPLFSFFSFIFFSLKR